VSNIFLVAKNRLKIKPLAKRSYIDKKWIASSLRSSQRRLQAALQLEKPATGFPARALKFFRC
jgi:hypothetical protein